MPVFLLQLFLPRFQSQELAAAVFVVLRNHFNCRARLNSGIENNIVVAKFSTQIRKSFLLAPQRQKVFPCQYIQSKWFDGDFLTAQKSFTPASDAGNNLCNFMRTFNETFGFNCSARIFFSTKASNSAFFIS